MSRSLPCPPALPDDGMIRLGSPASPTPGELGPCIARLAIRIARSLACIQLALSSRMVLGLIAPLRFRYLSLYECTTARGMAAEWLCDRHALCGQPIALRRSRSQCWA